MSPRISSLHDGGYYGAPTILLSCAGGFDTGLSANPSRRCPAKNDVNVLERFEILKDGEGLLLPVTFNDQQYMFMLDTGCSVSVYDKVLKLGDPLGTVTADSPGGKKEIELFKAPSAHLGQEAAGSQREITCCRPRPDQVQARFQRTDSGYPWHGFP